MKVALNTPIDQKVTTAMNAGMSTLFAELVEHHGVDEFLLSWCDICHNAKPILENLRKDLT